MPKLKINAPDGKVLRIDLPPDATEDQYDKIANDVLRDYEMSTVETSGMEAAGRGFVSGVPGGTALMSGIQAMGDKTYEETRRRNELEADKAWEEHPVAYGAGKTAGLAGTAMVTPATIPGALAVGGAAGLDVAEKPEDMLESAAKGTVGGAAFGAAGKYIAAPAMTALTQKFAPAVGKRTASMIGEPTIDQVESYLKNPKAIREALTSEGVAGRIGERAGELGTAAGHLSQMARGQLSPTTASVNTGQIAKVFDDALKPYIGPGGKAATALDESAIKMIDDQAYRVLQMAEETGGQIPDAQLRGLIDKLQKMAKFNEEGQVGTSLKQKVAGDLQFRLKQLLEEANPAYAKAMAPSAEAASLSGKLKDTFKIEGGKPTDASVRQVSGILKEPKIQERELVDQIKDMTGDDIAKMIVDSQTKGAFDAPGGGPALKTFMTGLGFGAGKVTGVPFGGIGGAAVGRFGSEAIHGGNMAKRILDAYLDTSAKWQDSTTRALLDKYGPILANAAKVGGNQLAATHFVLGTSDPEYQELEDVLGSDDAVQE